MGKFMEKVPLPMAGLMLALATLGNLLAAYGSIYRNVLGFAAAVLFLLIAAKVIINPGCVREGFNNPVVAGVTPTFSMGLMILSTYVRSFNYTLALALWVLGVGLHILLMLYFTGRYVLTLRLEQVFPTYFIVYVGIVTGSVTAPAYQLAALGRAFFWFGFTANIILIPLVLFRLVRHKEMPEAARPTLSIFAAPTSLCLAGYLSSFPEKNNVLIAFLLALAVTMIVFALSFLPKLLQMPFYPSYSAFTFPFVISAVALKGTAAFLADSGLISVMAGSAGRLLEIWATAMVLYVLVRYTAFLLPLTRFGFAAGKKTAA